MSDNDLNPNTPAEADAAPAPKRRTRKPAAPKVEAVAEPQAEAAAPAAAPAEAVEPAELHDAGRERGHEGQASACREGRRDAGQERPREEQARRRILPQTNALHCLTCAGTQFEAILTVQVLLM